MFSYVLLHFKKCFEKYFLMFGCVLENAIENTFSTCCSHFLTFFRLPNKYIISFIPQYRNTNKTQKKNHQIRSHFLTFSRLPNKYIISFIPQYRKTKKTQKKKNHQIRSNWEKKEEREAIGFDEGLRSARCFVQRRDRDWRKGKIAIDGAIFLPLRICESFFLSLSFSLCASVSSSLCASQFRKWFEGKIKMKIIL